MKFGSRTVMGLGIFFVISALSYGALLYYFFTQTRAFALAEGKKQVENILLTHKAIRSYVEKVQKPEIYRLEEEGRLSPEYCNPKLLSSTYIARGIITEYLNQEREKSGLPPLYFKMAAENPRNELNAADAQERELLRRMRSGALAEYSEMVEADGHYSLYYAIPINKTVSSCLRCHGDPKTAPQDLLEQYGETKGFHEIEGDIRALISIRVPLDAQVKAAHLVFVRLSAGTGILLLLLFGVIVLSVLRLERNRWIILGQNEELQRLATVDMLTGVYNRQGFVAVMEPELEIGKRYDVVLSLIVMDLDFFKKINDTYGHGVGDAVLTATGKLLAEVGRDADIVARWGGEEFVIACPHTAIDGAVELAEKIKARLAVQSFPQGIKMTASFGVAQRHPEETLRQLIDRADVALYRSKETGRNRIYRAKQDEPETI